MSRNFIGGSEARTGAETRHVRIVVARVCCGWFLCRYTTTASVSIKSNNDQLTITTFFLLIRGCAAHRCWARGIKRVGSVLVRVHVVFLGRVWHHVQTMSYLQSCLGRVWSLSWKHALMDYELGISSFSVPVQKTCCQTRLKGLVWQHVFKENIQSIKICLIFDNVRHSQFPSFYAENVLPNTAEGPRLAARYQGRRSIIRTRLGATQSRIYRVTPWSTMADMADMLRWRGVCPPVCMRDRLGHHRPSPCTT